ncbi:hypothetical protein [Solimonas soli]|uniref:hypothetical protein n=1 Tax=Solimonas soli TaxID=413479 RepID=UPI0004894D0D|nr:hypothetical protein [Solimonas soli]
MTIIDAIAWTLMAAALLRSLREARDEHERSVKLEHWLAAVMLNGTALALWNVSVGPLVAFQHWLIALGALCGLRVLLQSLRRHAGALRPLQRAVPTASAAFGLLWLYALRP